MVTRSMRLAVPGRAAVALVVLGASAAMGLGLGTGVGRASAAAAVAVEPVGGCWSYVPSGAGLDAAPSTDTSTALEPWSASGDGGVELVSSGATAVGGQRHVAVTVVDGPVLSTGVTTSGTASFLLSVDGTALSAPIEVPFTVAAGEPVDGLTAEADLPIAAAGAHEIRLDGVYFDDPTHHLRTACNGQANGDATPGDNPATAPDSADLTTTFTAVTGASVTIGSISDQAVTNAARPADNVTLRLAGFASGAVAAIQACGSAGSCAPLASVTLGADGAADTTFMVPGSAPAGAGTLRIDDGATQASTPFTVLGTQGMTAAESLTEDATTVKLTGTGWDPGRDVTVQGYAGSSSSAAKTGDAAVVVRADSSGAFTASYEVSDTATVSVIADQARTSSHIGSVYLVSGVIGSGAVADTGTDTDADSDGDATGAGTTTSGSGTSTLAAPPADIPQPSDLPVALAGATTSATVPGSLTVSDIRLTGNTRMGDLFGGAPTRHLVFLVRNTGTTAVAAPVVRVSVGRSEDLKPQAIAVPVRDLPVGGHVVVDVPIELPMAAVGTYHVVGQVGGTDAPTFEVSWSAYPWGLLLLDAIALALLVVGVGHRLTTRRPRRLVLASGGADESGDGEAIVDLAAAERWWAARGTKSHVRAS